jgi:RNA polymerase sigma-70 factor (ECF subfamily)
LCQHILARRTQPRPGPKTQRNHSAIRMREAPKGHQKIRIATLRGPVHLYNCRSMNGDRTASLLVEQAQGGDRGALQAIYDLYAPRIHNFLLGMLGSREEAEDVTQQTFLIVLRQLGTLRDANQLESWIYRIARNEVYQKFRRQKVLREETDPLGADEGSGSAVEERLHADPERILLSRELRGALRSALRGLPVRLREAFVLGVIQGMSYKDVGLISGRSVLSVKTDVYRARLALKEDLKKYLRPGGEAGSGI